MAQSTTTAILIAAAGAVSKFILDREFSWIAALLIAVGAVGGYFVSMAIIDVVPFFDTASEPTKNAVMYFCGMFFPSLVRRIGVARIKANFGIIEVESKGDEQ